MVNNESGKNHKADLINLKSDKDRFFNQELTCLGRIVPHKNLDQETMFFEISLSDSITTNQEELLLA